MNWQRIKTFFVSAAFEYSVTLLFLVYLLVHDSAGLPSVQELIALIQKGFEHWGLLFLVFGLLLEGFFIVGLYFPGSTVAFAAVVFLGKTPLDILVIMLLGSMSLILVSFLNYWLGRHGYYRIFKSVGAEQTLTRMEQRFARNYKKTVALFASSPNFLAIASVYAGIAHVPLRKYIPFASVCVLFWVSIVSILLHLFVSAEDLTSSDGVGWIAFFVLLAWALFESISAELSRRKNIATMVL